MRVLLFDIDGTLLSTAGVGNRTLALAIENEFNVHQADTNISFSGRTDRGLMSELLQRNGVTGSDQNCGRLRSAYSSLFGEQLDRQGGVVLPGVRELLHALTNRISDKESGQNPKLELAVMTGNFPETATQKLKHFELHSWFSWISGGDQHADRDDLARQTAEIIHRRHTPTKCQAVVIGDTPADIRCGKAIGAQTVAVATGEYSEDDLSQAAPDELLIDFSDTQKVVEILAG